MTRIPSGTTDQGFYFVAVDATDFTTRETALSSFTVYRERNNGTAAAMTTPTVTEADATNMPGVYFLLCDEDTTIAAGNDTEEIVFHITHAGMAPVTQVVELYRPKITAGNTLGVAADGDISGNVDGNVVGSVASVTGAVGSVTGSVGSVTGAVGSVTGNVGGTINGITATALADLFDTDSGTTYASAVAGSVVKEIADNAGGSALTEAGIADAVWDELQSAHVTAGSFGEMATEIASILEDTAEIGAAGAGLTGIPWNAAWDAEVQSEVTDGLNAYDPPTKAELDSGLAALNDPTAAAIADAVLDEATSGHTTAGTLGKAVIDILADTNELQSDDVPGLIAALNDITVADVLTTQMTESYNADGTAPTLAQALFLLIAFLTEFSISGTTYTAKKLDGSTTAGTWTLNDATSPTGTTRAT